MGVLAQELLTRFLPFGMDEAAYARNRPADERSPWPKVGDRLWYRRHEWDVDGQLYLMQVVDVQDPGDVTSEWATNLVQHLRDNTTADPLYHPDGRPVIVPLEDPLPWVHLAWPAERDIPDGADWSWAYRIQMTFESRMRGSPGWLPLDYETRRRVQTPGRVPHRPGTAYRYRDGQLEHLAPGGDVWQPYP